MKKLALILTLLMTFSTMALSETENTKSSDPMGMMAAFMGVTEPSDSGEIGGGETVAPPTSASAPIAPIAAVVTTVTNSNTTTSTPYSYK